MLYGVEEGGPPRLRDAPWGANGRLRLLTALGPTGSEGALDRQLGTD